MKDLLIYEKELWKSYKFISGVDEVGRGCLAGPVVTASVILPQDEDVLFKLRKVNDSKALSEKKRNELFEIIKENALDYSIGIASANVIYEINILQATFLAMRRALQSLEINPEYVLVDGNKTIPNIIKPQKAIVKGDSNSLSIAAASILAKVTRDKIMLALDDHYPQYAFEKHKGYPTEVHRNAIKEYGLSDIHRVTFCKNLINI